MSKTKSFSQSLLESFLIDTASSTHVNHLPKQDKEQQSLQLDMLHLMLSEGSVFCEAPEMTVLCKTLEGNSAKFQSFSGWVKLGKTPFSSDVSRFLQIYICKRPPLIHLTKSSQITNKFLNPGRLFVPQNLTSRDQLLQEMYPHSYTAFFLHLMLICHLLSGLS